MEGVQSGPPSFVKLASHPIRWSLLTSLAESDRYVGELAGLTGYPPNLVSYHLGLLRKGGLVTATRNAADRRGSYYHVDLRACADALAASGAALHPAIASDRANDNATDSATDTSAGTPAGAAANLQVNDVSVLFICSGNSVRSPIAEALLRLRSAGRVSVQSAGTAAHVRLAQTTVRVLGNEYGIDVDGHKPRHVNAISGKEFDVVVTLCDKAREVCPEFDEATRLVHWSIPEPNPFNYADVRQTAGEIDGRVHDFLPTLAALEVPS